MRLDEWISKNSGGKRNHGLFKRLREETGLAYSTIHEIYRGIRGCEYETAKLLSEATGGKVSIAELCIPAKRSKPKRKANGAN